MGVSITLFRVSTAESITHVKDIKNVLYNKSIKSFNMDGMDTFLAVILTNKVDPFANSTLMGMRTIYGTPTEFVDYTLSIGGFIPASEVKLIADWLMQRDFSNYTDLRHTVIAYLQKLNAN